MFIFRRLQGGFKDGGTETKWLETGKGRGELSEPRTENARLLQVSGSVDETCHVFLVCEPQITIFADLFETESLIFLKKKSS